MYSSGHFRADNNLVRKTTAALIVIGLVWVSYIAWPLYQLTVLVRAIDADDVSTVVRCVNFDRVRASLTEQIASAYVRMSGIQPGPLGQQAVVVGLAVADPVIRKLVRRKRCRNSLPWAGQSRSCKTRRRPALSG